MLTKQQRRVLITAMNVLRNSKTILNNLSKEGIPLGSKGISLSQVEWFLQRNQRK